jgi:hypothetical protein
MKNLYRFYVDYRRMGSLQGLFVAEDTAIAAAMGKTLRFGEVLGKHSDIEMVLGPDDITLVTDDQEFIDKFQKYNCQSGRNPLGYLPEEDLEEE